MKNSNSYCLHFLRLQGEQTCNIGNPIVAIEEGQGCFTPRRPEPGETYPYEKLFNSRHELNKFLINRENNFIDHDKLFRDYADYGIDPYYEFVARVEDSEACIQPGSAALGGWQRYRAFHFCLAEDVLDLRSRLLLAAEFKAVCQNPIINLRSKCAYDTDADLDGAVAHLRHRRKHRWMHKRPDLPLGTPRFCREAQQWLHSRHREHGLMSNHENVSRCELAGECRCANAAEDYQRAKRKWSEELERDRHSVREEPVATETRHVWDDEG